MLWTTGSSLFWHFCPLLRTITLIICEIFAIVLFSWIFTTVKFQENKTVTEWLRFLSQLWLAEVSCRYYFQVLLMAAVVGLAGFLIKLCSGQCTERRDIGSLLSAFWQFKGYIGEFQIQRLQIISESKCSHIISTSQ